MSFSDVGILGKERVLLKAVGLDNTGKYIAIKTRQTDPGKISSSPENTYWFPDQQVKSGDFVVLNTGTGVNTNFANQVGTTTHAFYWGLSQTLLNHPQDSIAILRIESWEYKARS